jgi:hypothetical protein
VASFPFPGFLNTPNRLYTVLHSSISRALSLCLCAMRSGYHREVPLDCYPGLPSAFRRNAPGRGGIPVFSFIARPVVRILELKYPHRNKNKRCAPGDQQGLLGRGYLGRFRSNGLQGAGLVLPARCCLLSVVCLVLLC